MLIFFFGKEDFLTHQKIEELKTRFKEKNPTSVLDVFDASETEFDLIQDSLSKGGGLFSEKKLIILKDIFALEKSDQEKLIDDFKTHEKIDKENVIILFQKEVKDKKSKLYKYLKKEAKSQEFLPLDPLKLKTWIRYEIGTRSNQKVGMSMMALEKLALISKGNLWQLNNDIEKLVNFKEEGQITNEDLDLLCKGDAQAKIFDLVDAIATKNKSKAFDLMQTLLNQGENEFYIFTMVMFQIKNLVKVSDCHKKGILDYNAISKELGIHPFVAKKTQMQIRNFSRNDLKRIYQFAADTDLSVKTGELTMDESLIYFIAKV